VTDAHVDIAVVQLGPWDVLDQQLTPGGRYQTIGKDAELDGALESTLQRDVNLLLDHVSLVVLIAPPEIMPGMVDERPPTVAFPESDPARMARFRQIVGEVADRTAHVAVADLNAYVQAQPNPWRLRPDGVHTSVDTAKEVGDWLGPEIVRLHQLDEASSGGI